MLTSKQRAHLRGMATNLDTIFQIGKGDIKETFVKQIDDVLEARELIKIRVLENSQLSAREAAKSVADAVGAEVVGVIGSKMILYRESVKNKKIIL